MFCIWPWFGVEVLSSSGRVSALKPSRPGRSASNEAAADAQWKNQSPAAIYDVACIVEFDPGKHLTSKYCISIPVVRIKKRQHLGCSL